MAGTGLAEFYAGCTASHRREYLKWIGAAKKPETRAARIGKALEMLAERRAKEAAQASQGGKGRAHNGNLGRCIAAGGG